MTITLREAIALFPRLLDEPVLLANTQLPHPDTEWAAFQFTGDGNYRTKRLARGEKTHASEDKGK